ncbi:MAG: homoserine kinase [Faecalibacterium sp.]
MITVSVPATSANVGAGFDAIGLAVTLYNTAVFSQSDTLEISSSDGTDVPTGEDNLIYHSAKLLFERCGEVVPGMKIVQTNPIPMARGLGSSSACIIAGLLGANEMLGGRMSKEELLTLANEIEGHPDNVAPALLGGLSASAVEEGKVYSVQKPVNDTLKFAAFIPNYPLLTSAARSALPASVSHKQAIYNLSRAALLSAAFCDGRHDLIPVATQDSLHQQYRLPLMPGAAEIMALCEKCGALSCYVSGAGSTMMAVIEASEAEVFYEKAALALAQNPQTAAFTMLPLSVDNVGATVTKK